MPICDSSHNSILPFQTSKACLEVLLLHGNLDIWVKEAKNIPNMNRFHNKLGKLCRKSPDPYVTVSVVRAVIGSTFVIKNSETPIWLQHFNVPVAHNAAEVHFIVKDDDVVGSQIIGALGVPVKKLLSGEKFEGWFPLVNSKKFRKEAPSLNLSIQFTPIETVEAYRQGVGLGPDYQGVPGTYFPLRKGGTIKLYQDAHVAEGSLPNVHLDHGVLYEHGQCWHDVFNAIRDARRLIYITGWSVNHLVSLVRDTDNAENYILGNLLKEKSQEGLKVLLLVWDDPTSRNILGYKTPGKMATNDEETKKFFKHSYVHVILCSRSADKGCSFASRQETGLFYTHHQKTVIVDADAGQNRRKITAFVGGLDLTKGRYDTPGHPLFKTLQTTHKDDYHNPSFEGTTVGCPREPWHDLHCQIDGPAAHDILTNFEERWLKESKMYAHQKLHLSHIDTLLEIDAIPEILGISDTPWLSGDDPQGWHVQVFRSIDSNSVKGFPKDPKEATKKNLVCGKNVLIDMSIHTAYVKAIRSAQHFIYIENQYFLGSSYNWNQHKYLGADNLIPMEIAQKIASKIRARQRFSVYIVVPMWPEGVPKSTATQRILYWQTRTMEMMYETIYKALVEAQLDKEYEPQDFLNFFCLGNREVADHRERNVDAGNSSADKSSQILASKNRRFMIYVHSKGMIVDDEYVIIGSANINQRSMEGTRDSEIAMGAYQPHYTWAKNHTGPLGQVHGYRMSLWAEHIGGLESCFLQPESLECIRRVRSHGEQNWKQFAAEETTDMKGHLLKYPVEVDRTGKVSPLPGCETFPDIGGNITGSTVLPFKENLTI